MLSLPTSGRAAAAKWGGGIFVLVLVGIGSAFAQAAPPAEDSTPAATTAGSFAQRHGRDRLAIYKMLSAGQITSPATFDAYYTDFFREFAHRGNVARLPDLRRQLAIDLAQAGRAEVDDAHRRLVQGTLAAMNRCATDPALHTATRLSAALVMGELNDREYSATARRAAQPMSAALSRLLDLARPPVGRTTGADDSVRIAALIGIARHAEAGIAEESRRQAVLELTNRLLQQPALPPGRSLAGQDWLLRRAIDVVAVTAVAHKSPADGQALHGLTALVGNAGTARRVRVAAAVALAQVIERAGALPGEELADTWTQARRLAADLTTGALPPRGAAAGAPWNAGLARVNLYQHLSGLSALAQAVAEKAPAQVVYKAFAHEVNELVDQLGAAEVTEEAWTEQVERAAQRWATSALPANTTRAVTG